MSLIGSINLPSGLGINTPQTVSNAVQNAFLGSVGTAASASRSVANRFQDRASVLDYPGVVGNGTNDDTAGLQLAINDCAGKRELLFPAGYTHLQTSSLTIPANSYLEIRGQLIRPGYNLANYSAGNPSTYQWSQICITGSNVTIDGNGQGVIDGNVSAQGGAAYQAAAGIVTLYGSSGPSIFYNPQTGQSLYQNVHICNITVQNTQNWPVSLAMENSEVTRCIFNTANSSPQLVYSYNSHFRNCTAVNINDDGLGLYEGNQYCSVDSCFVSGCQTGPFILNDSTAAPQNGCRLVNNLLLNNTNAGLFVSGAIAGGNTIHCGVLISGNICINNGAGGAGAIDINCVQDCLIEGNIVYQTQYTTNAVLLGANLNNVTIRDNRFTCWNSTALQLKNDVSTNSDLLIESNEFHDAGGAYCVGILLHSVGSSAYVRVRDNSFSSAYGQNGSISYIDQSATQAALFDGVNGPDTAGMVRQTSQSLQVNGYLIVKNLPTSDPHVAGMLWSNSGVLSVSAG